MSDSKENSFDIQQAKALSHKLNPRRDEVLQSNRSSSAPKYPRFNIKRASDHTQQPPAVTSAPKETPIKLPSVDEFDNIESLLKWCHNLSKADLTFVVDGEGFVLSTYGHNSEEESEGTGAELSYALEQLDRMSDDDTKLLSICLEYNTKHVYGFQVYGEREERFILGLSSNSPFDIRVKEALAKASSVMVPMLS